MAVSTQAARTRTNSGVPRGVRSQRLVVAAAWLAFAMAMLVLAFDSRAATTPVARASAEGPSDAADAMALPAAGAAERAGTSAMPVPFVPQALAVTEIATGLYDHPARGREVARLAPGTPLLVGGYIDVPTGIWHRRSLWVQSGVGEQASFGFVIDAAVSVGRGNLARLDLRGADVASLLAPAPAGFAPAALAGEGDEAAADLADLDVPWLPDTVRRWREPIVAAGKAYGVDPNLVAILILVESGGSPTAESPSGALGLMQIRPATASAVAARRGLADHTTEQLLEPAYNIDLGTWYLADMLRTFGKADDPDWQQSVELAAAAYNGGPGTVRRFLDAGSMLPAESRSYRRWVGQMWSQRAQASSEGFEAWMAAGGARLVEAAGVVADA